MGGYALVGGNSNVRRGGSRQPARVGVLDLGSTSFHLLVADISPQGRLRRIGRKREMLRLGSELAQSPILPEAVFQRALAAAARLRAFSEREKVDRLVAVGTAALREARNGPELRDGIASVLGVPVRILTGHEEARIIFSAIRRRLSIGDETTLGLDLGGGSLEFALGNSRSVSWEATVPLGVARLQGQLIEEDRRGRIPLGQLGDVRARVRALVKPLRARIRAAHPARIVAVGGTVRALARLATHGRRSDAELNGLELHGPELRELAVNLARHSHAERVRLRGMTPRRADLLPIGAAVLATTLRQLEFPALTCCDWGLREGIALELLEQPRRRPALRVARTPARRG